MRRYCLNTSSVLLVAMAFCLPADAQQPIQELNPRPILFPKGPLTLTEALAQIQKHSGNTIKDQRTNPTNPKLTLPNRGYTFWQAMDAIGKHTGIGFSAYQPDGEVAWTDAPYREFQTHYSELFRFAVKRIAISRDDEAKAHVCNLTLDLAWEPRFQPLYLHLDSGHVKFAQDDKKFVRSESLERQSSRSVAGSSATEIDLRIKAPHRTAPSIDTLQGTIRVIGAPKMLDFTFTKLKAIDPKKKGDTTASFEKEGVTVSLTQVKATPGNTRWTVDVLIEYPKDAIVPLESYQSWMNNNRIWLGWTDPKMKTTRKLEPSGEAPLNDAKGTKLQFFFTPEENTGLPANLGDATLYYRTPNRVVAFTVPFQLTGLPLP